MASKMHIYHSDDTETYFIEEKSGVFLHATDGESSFGCMLYSLENFNEVKKEFSSLSADAIQVKIIGNYLLNRQLQQKIVQMGFDVEKAIYAEEFKLFYNASTDSIKLQKKDYEKIRLLVVDDSKVIRDIIKNCLSKDPSIIVVGEAESGQGLIEKIKATNPHVITLDMQMPVVTGVMALRQYLPFFPLPTVVVSAVSLEEGSLAMEAMESGAVDYLQKPLFDDLSSFKTQLIEKVKTAFESKYFFQVKKKRSLVNIKFDSMQIDTDRLIAIGSSTGGTEALREILVHLPKQIPPIVIVQHIPAMFSKSFAERMDLLCPFEVKEAEDGDEVKAGRVLIAPGGKQMAIEKHGSMYVARVTDDAPVNRHKPSVDYMFNSLVKNCNKKIVAVILTGMGADGAKGMKELKDQGAKTIGQNEASCIVYGMPQAAAKLNAVDHMIHLNDIALKIIDLVSFSHKKTG